MVTGMSLTEIMAMSAEESFKLLPSHWGLSDQDIEQQLVRCRNLLGFCYWYRAFGGHIVWIVRLERLQVHNISQSSNRTIFSPIVTATISFGKSISYILTDILRLSTLVNKQPHLPSPDQVIHYSWTRRICEYNSELPFIFHSKFDLEQ